MARETLRILTGTAHPALARQIADQLGLGISQMICRRFSDGEVQVKIQESVRGMDVFVIQPTCSPVNEHVMELLIILDALRRASPRRITCVMPYYGYARQDKKIKPREPVTAKLIADLITQSGANRILAIDLHADQIQGFFNLPVDHLFAGPLIADYLIKRRLYERDVVVVSPDVGGVTRARAMAETLDSDLAIIAKRRPEPNKAEIMTIIGDVRGRTAVMIDDMIDTAESISLGAEALMRMGARNIVACCTHAVLSGSAIERLRQGVIQEVVVTDTIPGGGTAERSGAGGVPAERVLGEAGGGADRHLEKLTILPVAPLLAEAIDRIHEDASVSELFLPAL